MALELDSFAKSLEADSGDSVLLSDERTESFRLGGKAPSVVASPATHEALCRVLSRANEADLAVFSPGEEARVVELDMHPKDMTWSSLWSACRRRWSF